MRRGGASQFRKEGFTGQRLVVLPPAMVTANRRHPLLSGLLPTDAGFFTRPEGHLVERLKGIPAHVLIVCLAGKGWYRLGNDLRTRPVAAGDAMLLPPSTPHAYGADDESPWSIEWVHFVGAEASAWRAALELTPDAAIVSVGSGQAGEIRLGRIHPHLEKGYGLPNLLAASAALRASLAELVQRRSVPGSGEPARIAVERSIERLREKLNHPVQLPEIAAEAGLSVSHYSKLFRVQTGLSPIDYFLRMRLQRAAQLLDLTTLRIEEVAAMLGYEDAYYFSRQFKRFMMRSPRAYRAVRKG